MNPEVQKYIHYYQNGGSLPVFRGMRDQYGGGLGSFFGRIARGIWDFIRPAAGAAATSFISNAAEGISEGKSLKDTARSALGASVGTAIRGIGDQAQKRVQSGAGQRRKRRFTRKRVKKTIKGRINKRRVYKQRKSSRKSNF